MKDNGLEGWCAVDTPEDGYLSEGELNIQKLIGQQNKKKNKSGCGFQAMGLSEPILKGIARKGYKNPTPIQRRSIPPILEGRDVVAMARTGSGKTASFLIPLFERLKVHSAQGSGIRGLILSPTRELALQTLAFAKQLGRFTSVRAAVVLGGDSMELQFQALTDNPDIVIATPGRFMHVCIQMNLKLSSVDYVVFDEADRLFEMGFAEQLRDIIGRLNNNRQTVLFSATLPKMMVEFARAGLNDPILIRLDVENKISENLAMAFFKVRPTEKVALLLHLLKTAIDVENEPTVIFAPTKHHVEYLHMLLEKEGIPNTYTYSSLDPAARKINVAKFRNKKVKVLIVTDIAARGIDIPILDNVINFNFPARTKLFIHRVGRVARAGRKGCAFSFVSPEETGYLLELHMFINKGIKFAPIEYKKDAGESDWSSVYGRVPLSILDDTMSYLHVIHKSDYDLEQLRITSENGYKKYLKSCVPPSHETIRRLKREMWEGDIGFHPFLLRNNSGGVDSGIEEDCKRFELLDKLKNNRPRLTIFEVKQRGIGAKQAEVNTAKFMEEKRKTDQFRIEKYYRTLEEKKAMSSKRKLMEEQATAQRGNLEISSEVDLSHTFCKSIGNKIKKPRVGETEESDNTQHFIPYEQSDRHTEEALAVRSNFERDANGASFDLVQDSGMHQKPPTNQKKWDRARKKFVGKATQAKRVKTESGVWVNATYTRDLYNKWKLKSKQDKDGDESNANPHDMNDSSVSEPKKQEEEEEKEKSDRFVTLNPRQRNHGKKHPLLVSAGKEENWNKRKRKSQQLATNREMFTYEERQKNIKHKYLKQKKQAQSTSFHKTKKKEAVKQMRKKKK